MACSKQTDLQTAYTGLAAMPLQDVFEQFKQNKAALRRIHEDAIKCFDNIVSELSHPRDAEIAVEMSYMSGLSPPTSPNEVKVMARTAAITDVHLEFRRSLAEELYTSDERKQVEALFSQEPAIIVVGQTNCGKSSIINELLGVKALPTSDRPSTARIVRATYSAQPFCHLVDRDGKIIQQIKMKDGNRIPRKSIVLTKEDRENPTEVEAAVVVGLDNEFLKAGVTIIDSPGRNENDALDKLVHDKLDHPLTFVIYVIDGRNLFTKQDRDVLTEMRHQRPELDIFFVVSKLEPEERESSDDDDEEDPRQQSHAQSVQARKKERVYDRLIKNGFLTAPQGVSMEDNDLFHGLSAWKIQQYNEKKSENPEWKDPDRRFYIDAFQRFQNCVKTFAETCLRSRVENACRVLIRVLSRCMDFFIQKANVLKKNKQRTMKLLDTLRREELKVHENIIHNLQEKAVDIKDLLRETFEKAHDGILEEARMFEYVLKEVAIPRDGYVTTKEVVIQCLDQLQNLVVNKLQGEVKEQLIMMFHSRDEFVEQLKVRIMQVEEETTAEAGVLTGAQALTRSLLSSYETPITLKGQDGSALYFMKIFKWLYDVLCDPIDTIVKTIKGKVQVGSPKWKENVASRVLKHVDSAMMADQIVNSLKQHFTSCHEEFSNEIKKIQDLFERGETIRDEQRKKVLDFAPTLALLEMLAYSVNDRIRIGHPEMGELLGSGAQGSVFACDNIKTPEGRPCVVKVVSVSGEEVLKDLTVELHNSRFLQHPNILPIICTIVEAQVNRGLNVLIVSERMKCDLQEGLPMISSLRKRLSIGLDVAQALQYLHARELIHRDVKVQNVLLDESNKGMLTDMGLCKPEGLANCSLVGTPINMAPEMIKQNYGKPIDVYAFGMLLWRLCEGQGNQPQNIHRHFLPLVMLMLNAVENKTPERLDIFHESCWQLMEKCWQQNPEERPSFDSVVKEMQDILSDPTIE